MALNYELLTPFDPMKNEPSNPRKSKTARTSATFPFEKLSREIRCEIFKFVFGDVHRAIHPTPTPVHNKGLIHDRLEAFRHTPSPCAILATDKQTYNEAIVIYYSTVNFHFFRLTSMDLFLARVGIRNSSLIQHISCSIFWGESIELQESNAILREAPARLPRLLHITFENYMEKQAFMAAAHFLRGNISRRWSAYVNIHPSPSDRMVWKLYPGQYGGSQSQECRQMFNYKSKQAGFKVLRECRFNGQHWFRATTMVRGGGLKPVCVLLAMRAFEIKQETIYGRA
jgi:hypothetical protein